MVHLTDNNLISKFMLSDSDREQFNNFGIYKKVFT